MPPRRDRCRPHSRERRRLVPESSSPLSRASQRENRPPRRQAVAGSPARQEEPAQAGEALDAPGGRRRLTQEGSHTSDQLTQEEIESPTTKKRSEERLGHRTKGAHGVASNGETQPVAWP